MPPLHIIFALVWIVGNWLFWKKYDDKLYWRFSLIGILAFLVSAWDYIAENKLQLSTDDLILSNKLVAILDLLIIAGIIIAFIMSRVAKNEKI